MERPSTKVFIKGLYALFFFALLLISPAIWACHNTGITEVSATDNGDGTFTYELEVCLGGNSADSESFGFWVDWTGGGSLVGYTDTVTGPTTGNKKGASVPPVSGDGSIEYGDWDDTSTDTLSTADVIDCMTIELTFDEPMQEFTAGGMQPNYESDGCTETDNSDLSTDATYVCNSSSTYQLGVDVPNENNKNYTIEFDGNEIANEPANGGSETYNYCGDCPFTFSAYMDKNCCDINSWEVTDSLGNTAMSGTGDVTNKTMDVCTLPIELLSFESQCQDDGVTLTWKTATERNNSHFRILRSRDGENFEELTRVEGAGTKSQTSSYEAFDPSPYAGVTYYRLVQVDQDGERTKYTPIASSCDHGASFGMEKPYPNPSNGEIQTVVSSQRSGKVQVSIIDRTGRIVRKEEVSVQKGPNNLSFNFEDLSEGYYFMSLERLDNSSKRIVEPFTIQK